MKRLFGKFSRSPSRSAEEGRADSPAIDADVPATDAPVEAGDATSSLPPPIEPDADRDVPEFELREPTPEEMSATILSRQDFADLDRMFAGTARRTVQLAKPPVLSRAVAQRGPGKSVAETPPGRPPADVPAPAGTAPAATIEPPAVATPIAAPPPSDGPNEQSAAATAPAVPAPPPEPPQPEIASKARLRGFLEGFVAGKHLDGWAGDPDAPRNWTLRVSALLDGKEVASTIADRARKDTEFAGWQIPFPDPLIAKYILANRLTVCVAREGEEPINLKVLPNVLDRAKAIEAEAAAAPEAVPEAKTTAVATASPPTNDLSFVRIPVGTISRNQAVILGRDGFLFPYHGLGDLAAQYAIAVEEEVVQRDAAKWFMLFRSREESLKGLGIPYLQTILPEKATVLPDLAPSGLGPLTARLGVLEAMFAAAADKQGGTPPAYYRSLITALRSCHTAGIAPYLRTGAGLRTAGTQLVFYQLVQRMAALLPDHAEALARVADLCGHLAPGKENEPFVGDLGQHFDFPVYESEQLPDLEKLAPHAAGDANVIDRRDGGSRFVWRNPNAPNMLKVIVFGQSCLGRGGNAVSLAWWFKALFGEFHLVELAELDHAYIEQHKPHIVIAISQERTLPTPPAR